MCKLNRVISSTELAMLKKRRFTHEEIAEQFNVSKIWIDKLSQRLKRGEKW